MNLFILIYLYIYFMCVYCHLDPLSFWWVGQLVHTALDVVQPSQQVMRLPPVLVPLGSDGQCLPVPQHTQVLHTHAHMRTETSQELKRKKVIKSFKFQFETFFFTGLNSEMLIFSNDPGRK